MEGSTFSGRGIYRVRGGTQVLSSGGQNSPKKRLYVLNVDKDLSNIMVEVDEECMEKYWCY